MFIAGTADQRLLYLDHRLSNRQTFCEFDKKMMGPILDTRGLEQGGVSSSDLYKLYNNEQLVTAHSSSLGVDIDSAVISAVGQADDVILMANDISNLHLLVKLTENYCEKYRVKLEPKKTKLLAYSSKKNELLVKLAVGTNPITINSVPVPFNQ